MTSAAYLTRNESTCRSGPTMSPTHDSPCGLKMELKIQRAEPRLQRLRLCWRHKRGYGQPEACPSAGEVEERAARAGSHERNGVRAMAR